MLLCATVWRATSPLDYMAILQSVSVQDTYRGLHYLQRRTTAERTTRQRQPIEQGTGARGNTTRYIDPYKHERSCFQGVKSLRGQPRMVHADCQGNRALTTYRPFCCCCVFCEVLNLAKTQADTESVRIQRGKKGT